MSVVQFTKEFVEQELVAGKGTIYDCVKPHVGLILRYCTSLSSYGHNHPCGYIVTCVYTKKGTNLVNKADIAYILSANKELNTVTYDDDPENMRTIFLTQGGNWNMRKAFGSDPYIQFGELQLPWTAEEKEAHDQYSLGN